MRLAWGAKVSPEFCFKVVGIAERIGCDPNWIMGCMAFETGRTFDPSKVNPSSGATGLIQFMPSTAAALGTSVQELAAMPAERQLGYVLMYFLPFAGRIRTLSDCYMAILWPKGIGLAETAVLFTVADRAYLNNRGLDIDHDNAVTKAEAASFAAKALEEGFLPGNVVELELEADQPAAPIVDEPQLPKETGMGAGLAIGLIQTLLSNFSGGAQSQLAPLISQVASIIPGAAPPPAGSKESEIINLANNMMATILKVAGVKNPETATDQQKIQATMAVAADPVKVKAVEEDAMARLEKLGPTFDRLAAADKAFNEAAMTGRNAAMIRQQADTHGTVQLVVQNVSMMSWVLIGGLIGSILAAVICKAVWKEMPDYFTTLIALTGPLAGQIMKERGAVIAYYFDGTPSSNAANAINSEIVASGKK